MDRENFFAPLVHVLAVASDMPVTNSEYFSKKPLFATKIYGYREMTRVYFLTMAGLGVRFLLTPGARFGE
jgi:hypothetical protein